jgi:heat shock protein HslJ
MSVRAPIWRRRRLARPFRDRVGLNLVTLRRGARGERPPKPQKRLRATFAAACALALAPAALRGGRPLGISSAPTLALAWEQKDGNMKRALLRMAITSIAAIALGAVFAAHAARAEDDKTPKPLPPQQKNFPLGQTWSLRELNGKPIDSTLDVSLKIDSALRGSGFTGCNSWSATMYPVKDQHLLTGPYALTKKQCDKDVMAIELGFLSALMAQPSWDLVNGELVIKGPRGALRLVRSL